MNHTTSTASLVGALLLLAGSSATAQELELTPDQRALFALIDEFDQLDTSKLPFGRITIRRSPPGHTPLVFCEHGYLVKSDRDMFTIRFLFLGLRREVIPSWSSRTPAHTRCAFHPMDIRPHARKVVSELREDGDFWPLGGPIRGRAAALILARDLARRGHAREFEMVWSVFRRPDRLRSTLAWATEEQLVLDFGDAALSHADLLRRHQLWLRKFPKHPGRKSVAPRTDQLERIVAEKRKRATSSKTKAKTVADLIFDLRNEFHSTWTPWIQSHPVDPVVPTPRDTVTPREQLRKVGVKAVPALIEALEDEAPSRCVMSFRRYGGSFWVLSVGAQAEGLLRQITEQPDQKRKSTKWWREWYAAHQAKGKEAK